MDVDYIEGPSGSHSLPAIPTITTSGWTLETLIASGPRFKPVPRISMDLPQAETSLALHNHEESGIPLVLEGWHKHEGWPVDLFNLEWLRNHGQTRST